MIATVRDLCVEAVARLQLRIAGGVYHMNARNRTGSETCDPGTSRGSLYSRHHYSPRPASTPAEGHRAFRRRAAEVPH
jgi:hypothetical protein